LRRAGKENMAVSQRGEAYGQLPLVRNTNRGHTALSFCGPTNSFRRDRQVSYICIMSPSDKTKALLLGRKLPVAACILAAAGVWFAAGIGSSRGEELSEEEVFNRAQQQNSRATALPRPGGQVLEVSSAPELFQSIDRVQTGGTILIADGVYSMPRPLVLSHKTNITIRGASGDPRKVTLAGRGWEDKTRPGDLLHIGRCDQITIADITFADARSYGIKVEAENAPRDIEIHNCRFLNIGVRAIKGSSGQDPEVLAVRGSVRFCHFENTLVPPADWLFGGDYIAGIDMMALDGWTFSDNVFMNINGRNGGGRAAIFIWVRSRNVVVERNRIINCDRGVAFGNPGSSTADMPGQPVVHVSASVIRNNFIAGGPDCGIELWRAERIRIINNSIWRPERNWNRGIRIGSGTARTEIINNLIHGKIQFEGGEAQNLNNFAGRLEGYFADPLSGNLALTPLAAGAIGKGISLLDLKADIRGRPRGRFPDLGAWESAGKEDPGQ
jgi:hypothetical protein